MLLSLTSYAEIAVTVTMSDGQSPCGGNCNFKTQLEVDTWKADNISNDSWGKKQRWELFTDQTDCLQMRDLKDREDVVIGQECERPVEYTITETDITAEVNVKKAKKDADGITIESIKAKLLDGSAKLEDLIEYLRIKEGL